MNKSEIDKLDEIVRKEMGIEFLDDGNPEERQEAPLWRKVLAKLSQTREPVQPSDSERSMYDKLFARRYLAYTYDSHRDGYVITADGRELISPHRQGERP